MIGYPSNYVAFPIWALLSWNPAGGVLILAITPLAYLRLRRRSAKVQPAKSTDPDTAKSIGTLF